VNGSDPGDRMAAAGYGAQGWGENIAYASGGLTEATVRQLHTNLMNSPGHYANIVNGSFEEIGIGLKEGTINGYKVVFVTQNFGTPNAAERAEANDVGTVTPPATGGTITGTGGNDVLAGTAGNDAMYGLAGNDTYYVNQMGDKAHEQAGQGIDTVISTITYSLAGQVVENLTLTGSGSLNGTGNSLGNTLIGNAGANILDGGSARDVINGKGGQDVLIGGAGNDTFVFDTASDANGDTINDFVHGADRISLTNIDANTRVAGDQAFAFIGAQAFHKVAGELRAYQSGGNTYVAGDVNGDGAADFAIKALGAHSFAKADFLV
jgi:serralysin